MDVKIICKDDNYYFRFGISELINEAFLFSANVGFLTGFDSENLAKADIVIISVSLWRLYLCQPAYQYRKSGSVLLIFTEQPDKIIAEHMPVCYQSLTVISWNENVTNIKNKIIKAWLKAHDDPMRDYHPSDCKRCCFSRISLVQLQVMSFLKKGNNVQHTAQFLGLSVKTVYAHKYNVMKKYNIKGDYEFHAFLNTVSLIELYKGVIEDA